LRPQLGPISTAISSPPAGAMIACGLGRGERLAGGSWEGGFDAD